MLAAWAIWRIAIYLLATGMLQWPRQQCSLSRPAQRREQVASSASHHSLYPVWRMLAFWTVYPKSSAIISA
jgi:hypothetical protein